MRFAFFSDIHGNVDFFNQCLINCADLKIDKFFFLGDAVGYLPKSPEVLDILKKYNFSCVKGNHEAMMLGELELGEDRDKIYQLRAARKRLSHEHLEYIQSWKVKETIKIQGKEIVLSHGTPFNPLEGYLYPQDSLEDFYGLQEDIFVMGHTHHPFVRTIANKTIVNIGSTGLPRDQGNMASFGIMDDSLQIRILRLAIEPQVINGILNHAGVDNSVKSVFKRTSLNLFGEILKR